MQLDSSQLISVAETDENVERSKLAYYCAELLLHAYPLNLSRADSTSTCHETCITLTNNTISASLLQTCPSSGGLCDRHVARRLRPLQMQVDDKATGPQATHGRLIYGTSSLVVLRRCRNVADGCSFAVLLRVPSFRTGLVCNAPRATIPSCRSRAHQPEKQYCRDTIWGFRHRGP